MLCLMVGLTALYLYAGAVWWGRIVLSKGALGEAESWRTDLVTADARGDVALLLVKGGFVMLWPLVLAAGWMASRSV